MGRLDISLLGGFGLTLDGRHLNSFVSDKARALIAYLAIESDRPHRRSNLASLLWADQPEPVSRTNLRQTLHRLLQTLGSIPNEPPYFLVTYQDLQFNIRSNYWLDVVEFSRLLETYRQHHSQDHSQLPGICQACLKDLKAAVDLYCGDILSGFSFSGCSDFEWWLTCRQEEYHRQAIETIKMLIAYYEQDQDYSHALQYSQHAIELEPWSEFFHRQKMELLAHSGQRIAALRQYERCRQILAKELGVPPSKETTALFEQIKGGNFNAQ